MSGSVQLEHSDVVFTRAHVPGKCKGTTCTLHNRSNHHLRSWPQIWNPMVYAMERLCAHGIGHIDPDETNKDIVVKFEHEEKCDGCCIPR
jgi:hypothetical protein